MNTQEYLSQHALTAEFVKDSLGWAFDETTITIPIYDENGKLLFCRYRHTVGEQKFTTDKGAFATLYCLHKIKKYGTVVLCEGEPDTAKLWQEGIPATTSTSGVKSFTEELAEPLRGKKVYLCLDSDRAGQESIPHYISTLEQINATVKIVPLPPEYKDVSLYFASGKTAKDFEALMSHALTADEWLEKYRPEDYKLETDEELLADTLPEEEWLIYRVLPSEGFTFFVGGEATGKSFYTLTIGHAVVTGDHWLETFPVKKQTNVLYIDKENSRRITQDRMRGLGYTSHNGRVFRVRYPEKFQITDDSGGFSQFALTLSRDVKRLDIGLVIVDSFTDVMIGKENAAEDVQKFFDAFRILFPNRAILILHHENKPSQGVQRTSSQRTRGSGNIPAQMASGFRIEAVPKTKGEFTIEQTKIRTAEKLSKFKVSLVVKPDPHNSDKTIVTNIQYDGEVLEEKEKTEEAINIIREQLSLQKSMTRKELLSMFTGEGLSESSLTRALREMTKSKIIEKGRQGKETFYTLSESEKNDEEIEEIEDEQQEIFID